LRTSQGILQASGKELLIKKAAKAAFFQMKLRLCRNEARSAHEARLRRVKCLPLANVKVAFCVAKSIINKSGRNSRFFRFFP
jgi:hypothetical protein